MTRIPSRYTGYANINFLSQGFRNLSSDRQTDRHNRNYIPRRFAGGQKLTENHKSQMRQSETVAETTIPAIAKIQLIPPL